MGQMGVYPNEKHPPWKIYTKMVIFALDNVKMD